MFAFYEGLIPLVLLYLIRETPSVTNDLQSTLTLGWDTTLMLCLVDKNDEYTYHHVHVGELYTIRYSA